MSTETDGRPPALVDDRFAFEDLQGAVVSSLEAGPGRARFTGRCVPAVGLQSGWRRNCETPRRVEWDA